LAGGIGYLLGGWHTAILQGAGLSPSQSVALRFLDDSDAAAPADQPATTATTIATTNETAPASPASASGPIARPMVLGATQLALLSPEPLVQATSQTEIQSKPAPAPRTIAVQPAAAPPPRTRPAAAPPRPVAEARLAAAPANRPADPPPGFLNDAQISSIKHRLHLTPDQERMWPAVEAALRNIAYAKAREARRRGLPANTTDLAAINPNGAEVQDLKSAAIPLTMSFNDDQRNEVRSLAHVMGLDRLASEF
jgi:hypothetical protein